MVIIEFSQSHWWGEFYVLPLWGLCNHYWFLLHRFFFRSGNIEHPEDKLFNTTVEVLPFDVSLLSIFWLIIIIRFLFCLFIYFSPRKAANVPNAPFSPYFPHNDNPARQVGLKEWLGQQWLLGLTPEACLEFRWSSGSRPALSPRHQNSSMMELWNYSPSKVSELLVLVLVYSLSLLGTKNGFSKVQYYNIYDSLRLGGGFGIHSYYR